MIYAGSVVVQRIDLGWTTGAVGWTLREKAHARLLGRHEF